MKLPRAILLDLDDTILVAFGPAQSQWQRTIAAFGDQLGPIEATVICGGDRGRLDRIMGDSARHKYWRHRTGAARRRIVATAFAALAVAGHPVPPEAIGDALCEGLPSAGFLAVARSPWLSRRVAGSCGLIMEAPPTDDVELLIATRPDS